MKSFRFLAATFALAVCSTAAWGQGISSAQIQGTVQDASGLAVPGAEIKATQTETGISRTTTTGADGGYVLPNLPVGPYSLEVTKQGFAKYVQTGIVLQVAANPTIDIALKVGAVSEQVSVEANAAMVETQNTAVGQIMENQRILELPLNGRNPADLIQLSGAAVGGSIAGPAYNASSRSFQGVLGGEGFSVAGGQSSGIAYLLDGTLHNNAYDNLNLPLPFPDALQEFKLETSALTAQNGIHGGATVNAVTKSGTNEFHGDVFEFLRNNKFNATNPFAGRGPDGRRLTDGLKRNQFGGTIGGPIKKNKLFFFGGWQETLTRITPADTLSFIPTAQMLAGDFTTFASPACNAGRQVNLGAPFSGNRIAPSLFSPAALKIVSRLPTTADPCGQIRYTNPLHQNEYQAVGKGDYQVSAKNSLFGRYMATTLTQVPPYALGNNILQTTVGGRDNLAQSVTLGDTHLIGASMVNSFRMAMNRTAIHRTSKDFFSAPEVGINVFSYMPHYMLLTITGGFALGGGTESESTFRTTTFQLGDDFSWVRGSHQISFGASGARWQSSSQANVRSPGPFTFDGSATGLGLADFLVGRPSLYDPAAPNTLFMAQWYLGLYAQDTWKISPRVTLNYGLRWEPWFPQIITNGNIYNFSFDRFTQGNKSAVYKNAPAGLYYPGDPGFPGKSGQYRKMLDFQPRVGIAWDPLGDGKMSIRASYGLFYDFANGQFFINSTIAPPFGDEVRVPSPAGGLDDPWRGVPGGNPFPIQFNSANALFPFGSPYLTVNYDMPATALHSWNLSIQRQIASNWLVSASYIANETQHLWASTQLNPGVYIPGNCTAGQYGLTAPGLCSTTTNLNQRRVLSLLNPAVGQYYGYVDVFDPGGTQSYNGLLVAVQHRLSHGLTISGNYTWSHCIGDYSQEFTTPNVGSGYQVPNNRRYDRGDCALDRRHNFNMTGVYQLPRFRNGIVRAVVTGWKISPIFRYISGAALTTTTGVDRALNGNTATQRPMQLLPDPYAHGFLNYLNSRAFTQPALGTLGNMGTYSLRGPGVFQIDTSLARVFRVTERKTLEIRGEAFNLPNFFLRNNPTVAFSSPTFGTINTARDPRIIQLAAKFVF
ncbi:MAG: TonB-dependent receptor [Terriglobia bacterium]|nr:MAG: TonB-dependent receptor [Terriglobia bacterium]